jgi:structural maintenance of chromosome 4
MSPHSTHTQPNRNHNTIHHPLPHPPITGFNSISLRLKEMYQMITLGGDAELELVDTLDPFSEVGGGVVMVSGRGRERETERRRDRELRISVGSWWIQPTNSPTNTNHPNLLGEPPQGIVFSVRPPKKSWKHIANLSGGEKKLSSLALVFALHHYKPTPLYVMDEIDAALDFKNVSIGGWLITGGGRSM